MKFILLINILIQLVHAKRASEIRAFVGNKLILATSFYFTIKCNPDLNFSQPSPIVNKQNQTDLPEPTGTNMPVRRRIVLESALLMPRSALRDFPSLACLDNSAGTRQRCEPLRHPIPKEER